MTITVKKEIEETIEIHLPYFSKNSTAYTAIFAPDKMILVMPSGLIQDKQTINPNDVKGVLSGERITKAEFWEMYHKTVEKIESLTQISE